MNLSLGHWILSSAKEYYNYRLLKDLGAFSLTTGQLYEYSDSRFPNKSVYGSAYAQWAYHSEVSGVVVPSGITAGSFISRGQNGLAIDYKNGRAILNSGQTGLSASAIFSVQDINTYVTTRSDASIIAETNYLTLPNLKPANSYLQPDSQVLSALFFRTHDTENKPLALGGNEMTSYKVRIVALMKNARHLTAVADMIRDSKDRIMPILDQSPLNEYNDLKSGWSYANYLANPTTYAHITKSTFSFLEPDLFTARNPKLEVGIATLEFQIPRFPRAEFP